MKIGKVPSHQDHPQNDVPNVNLPKMPSSPTEHNEPSPKPKKRLNWVKWGVGLVIVGVLGWFMWPKPAKPVKATHPKTTAVSSSSNNNQAASQDESRQASSSSAAAEDNGNAFKEHAKDASHALTPAQQKAADAKKAAQVGLYGSKTTTVAAMKVKALVKKYKDAGHNSRNLTPVIQKGMGVYLNTQTPQDAIPSHHKANTKKAFGDSLTDSALDQLVTPVSIKDEKNLSIVTQTKTTAFNVKPMADLKGGYLVEATVKSYVSGGDKDQILSTDHVQYVLITKHNKVIDVTKS